VVKDFLEVSLAAKTVLFLLIEQRHHDVNEVVRVINLVLTLIGEHNLRGTDLEQQQAALLVIEGGHSDEHLVNQNAKRPPIHTQVVALVKHHFWSQVLRCTAEGLRSLVFRKGLCQSIVNNLKVASFVNQDIFQLQVSVHDSLVVEVADSQNNLSRVKFNYWLGKSLLRPENFVKLTALNERHHEVKPLR